MTKYSPSRKCLWILDLIILMLTTALICLSSCFLALTPMFMKIINSVFLTTGLFLILIYLPVYFKNLCYIVSENKITKNSGFFFTKKQTITIDSIQYTTSITTWFSEKTGLNFFILYAYGGTMKIMFLNDDDYNLLSSKFGK